MQADARLAMRHPPEAVATVFFDGACPLCRREIAHYRQLRGAGSMAWVDISSDDAALAAAGLGRDAAMARLHVLPSTGKWQTGAWAFAELWSHLPAYRWLAGLLRAAHLLPLADRLYAGFARWRIDRQCREGTCKPPTQVRSKDDPV